MILSDKDIKRCLRERTIQIIPAPEDAQIDTTTIDLRIGEPIWEWNPELLKTPGLDLSVDLDEIDYLKLSSSYLLKVEKERSGQYVVEPHRFYLAPTFEKVGLPTTSKIAARVEGRSTLGRLGLVVHMTAPTIHSGYGATKDKGPGIITLEIFNYGPFKICVTPGRRLFVN